jgi:DNA-binding NtrC family response regulator
MSGENGKIQLRPDGGVRHIVIIDDDGYLLNLVKELLSNTGFSVSAYDSGVEALKMVMTRQVDAILCDFLMPSMNGEMFYKAVERVKPDLLKGFILMTGDRENEGVMKFVKSARPVVLYKPITLGKLLGTLRIVFKTAEQ